MDMTLLIILGAAGTLLALQLATGFALLRQRRRAARREADLEAALARVRDDLAAMCSAAHTVGDHINDLDQRMRRLTERHDQLELRAGGERSYTQAIQLVQRGAASDELMANCGLTRGEADLIVMLHGGVAQAG